MEILEILKLFFLLVCGHMLVDFALQNDWVARNKNRHVRDQFSDAQKEKMEIIWPWLLSAHAFHHGLLVYFFTQSFTLGVAETVTHWLTDFGKCEKWYNFHADQFIHIATKLVWTAIYFSCQPF